VSGLALRKARWQAAALAAVFKFVLFNSQARRGDRDGVTNESNPEMTLPDYKHSEPEKVDLWNHEC
jgi:hypothetical protein